MAVYSNMQIRAAIDEGHIVCTPFIAAHIRQASLDISLGHYFYRIEQMNERTIYNPFNREDVERYFDGPFKAVPHGEWAELNGFTLVPNIPANHPVISLKPYERILAHSHEFVGILPPGACEVRCRSSWARNGIAVCFDAGWVNPGYINRLTLQIYNLNERETVLLPVGERVAQIIFHETGEVEGGYGKSTNGQYGNKYQRGSDLETIIRTWSPDMMLPQAYKDERTIPPPIEGMAYD
jgi:deoxycytidine triphosphate deaminase